jgi:hypothetical protein
MRLANAVNGGSAPLMGYGTSTVKGNSQNRTTQQHACPR